MHRFFVQPDNISNNKAIISGEDAAHIIRVLRLAPNDEITICNSANLEYTAKIESVKTDTIECSLLYERECEAEPKCSITLYQGLPKLDKLELIIQKCVEIGAVKIVPVVTARCVALPGKNDTNKIKRYQRIAYEAAKQSGRGIIPEVENITELKKCNISRHDLTLFCYEAEKRNTLKQVLRIHADAKDIGIIIGPEGGFEQYEAEWAQSMGAVPVTLGNRILRTETAGIAALAQTLYELDMP